MRFKVFVVLALVLAVAIAGCGSSSSSSSSSSHNTGSAAPRSAGTAQVSVAARETSAFTTHAGLAFGTFYHFIYTPYRAGQFRTIFTDRAALAKATAVATYVAAQVDQATAAVGANAALAKFAVPMKTLDVGFRTALAKLKTGRFKMSEIETANLAISAIKGAAIQAGMPISEATPSAI